MLAPRATEHGGAPPRIHVAPNSPSRGLGVDNNRTAAAWEENNAKTQVGKERSRGFSVGLWLHGPELWIWAGNQQGRGNQSHPHSSRAWRYLLRHRRGLWTAGE